MVTNPSDMIQDEHDDVSGTKRILLYGTTTASTVTPLTLNDDGTLNSALDDLTDVSLGTPTDSQVLSYDSASSMWTSSTIVQGTGAGVTDHGDLDGLTDDDHTQYLKTSSATVAILTDSSFGSLAQNDVMIYNTASSVWTNSSGVDNWNTAYGWGDHSTNSYISSLSVHNTSSDHDGRYYTETEIDSADAVHNTSSDHDGRYYTETELDVHLTNSALHFTEASIDHNAITNTHNLTTDIDHDTITNNHNLTTDIDHDTLTNYTSSEHFTKGSINIDDLNDVTISSVAEGELLSYSTASSAWINQTFTELGLANHPHQDVTATASPTFVTLNVTTIDFGTNTITDGNLTGDWDFNGGDITCADITLDNGGQDYIVRTNTTHSGIAYSIQSQTSGSASRIGIFTKDGDGTDANLFRIWGTGVPTASISGKHNLLIGWLNAGNYIMFAGSGSGFTGDFIVQNAGNTGQLTLLNNGNIELKTGQVNIETGDLILNGDGNNINVEGGSLIANVEIFNNKSKMTEIGGYAIKLTNKTGGNTVAGQIVCVYTATAVDDAFRVCPSNALNSIGIVLDTGVSDGSEAWVVVSGIADTLIDAGGCVRGDRMITSATAGSADVNNSPSTAVHFQEIGHSVETRTGAGLARCVLHFL